MPNKVGNVLSWAVDLDGNALDQAHRTSKLPVVEGHLALMPDAHWGMGATIGSVIPTRGAVIPAAVGVDIGCGMVAARMPFTSDLLPDDLSELHSFISTVVPAGVGKGHKGGKVRILPPDAHLVCDQWQRDKAASQMGTLGSGNHFIEVCTDEVERVWVVLHSGSRGIGNDLAKIHIDAAKKLMRQYFIHLDDPDLAYLVEGTPEFSAYIRAMTWAQDYAYMNRQVMLDAVMIQLQGVMGLEFSPSEVINCHHNFTTREHHGGKDVWLTRKGAIRARVGDRGVIPGSMGTRSYIVTGLGNTSSYCSCSHGAGRRMSRGEAKRTLDHAGLTAAMEGKVWNGDLAGLIDEDPRAYKDIDEVMAAQADLCTIDHTLTQLLNYKGQ